MRFSLSIVFAVLISFLLLGVMANLVQQQELPTAPPSTLLTDITLIAPEPTPEKPIRPTLPEQKKAVSQPPGPPIEITPPDENGIGPTLPPIAPGLDPTKGLPHGRGEPDYTIGTDTDNGPLGGLVPISQLQPQYPRAEAAKGIEGWVSLRFEVRQDGTVGNVRVLNGSPRGVFDQAAVKAVQRWRYRPTEQGPVVQTVTLDFKLEQ
ncbi:MAG: TonB family protein [Pseudomonadota bacterium]